MKNIGREDLSWEEVAICNDYAEIVIKYCRENDFDLSGPTAAEAGIMECNKNDIDFEEWCSFRLEDYIDDIIIAVGMHE